MNKKRKILLNLSLILVGFLILIYSTVNSTATPTVNLLSPSNNIFTTNLTQVFSINISNNVNLTTARLYVWNSSGNKINIGNAGNMWATVTTTTAVSKVLPNGTIVANYTSTGNSPWAIAFDGVNMWTANTGDNSVTKVLPNGTMITYSGTSSQPNDIAFDGVNMWTANNGGNSVTKVLPNGTMISYSGTGSAPGGIAFDGVNMWVANIGGSSVTKVNSTGGMTTYSGTGCNPVGIAFDGVNMWTTNYGCNSVTKVAPNGTMTTYPGTGTSNYKIAFDGTNMWTSNAGPGSAIGNITKVTPNGSMTNYTGGPTGYYPFGIAFDGLNMWVANEGGNVQKILPNGTFIFYNGTAFGNVGGIAFDGATLVPPFRSLNLTNLSGTSNSTSWTFILPGNGVYTWNVLGIDTAGNYSFSSSNYTITIDTIAPNVTIISPLNGNTYSSISQLAYSASDNIGLSSCWYSTNGGATNSSPDLTCSNFTITPATGNNTWTVYVNDTSGYLASASATFTLSPPAAGGNESSSSGGGGGGGSVTTSSGTTSIMSFSTPANTPVTMNINSNATGLTQLMITTNQQVSNAIVTISPIPLAQLQIASVTGQTYQSFQILTSGVNDSQITNVAINFQVNNSWISSNNLDPANISLYRNSGGSWGVLPTTLISHDSQYYYFTAISPGFSNYMILAESIECENGATRCLLSDSQICSSNVWILSQHCQIGCGEGRCITTSKQATNFLQNILNSLQGFINKLPGTLQLSIGTVTYYFLFIIIISGVVIVSTTLVRTVRKRAA